MKTKTYATRFKALDTPGQFEAIVAVFGNVDRAGDRIVKGAFAASLADWEVRGRPIPVIFSHRWDDLDAHIGRVVRAEERDDGLYVEAQLDMDEDYAARVWKKMRDGTLAEFSFAYDVIEEKRQNGANELLQVALLEVGPTLVGMNPETQLLGVKDGREMSGRTLQALHDLVRELGAVCAEASSTPTMIATGEEPKSAKPKERSGRSYAARVALELLELAP